MENKRNLGFYWIKVSRSDPDEEKEWEWEIAFYNGCSWRIVGSTNDFEDSDFSEIDEKELKRENK